MRTGIPADRKNQGADICDGGIRIALADRSQEHKSSAGLAPFPSLN
jgi:hypothetical protein